jgi:hypothetical protein
VSYVYAGYGITLVALLGYAARLVARDRRLRKR